MGETLQVGALAFGGERLGEVCRRHRVRELAVFGSAARGEMTAESDVDLMVEFEAGARVGLVEFAELSRELEELAGRKVDLVTKRGLKAWVRPGAMGEARVLYAA